MRTLAAILILICCVEGCDIPGPGAADFSTNLAGDYFLQRSSAHEVHITPSSGWSPETPIIPTKVIECAVDRHFVLAKRQGLKRRSPNNPADTYEEPDPYVFDYWILDTNAPRVFGPLDIEQFNRMKHEFGISESTVLKDVYSFRP